VYHVLYDYDSLKVHFDQIRSDLIQGTAGRRLTNSGPPGKYYADWAPYQIWFALMGSLEFDGTDFEHAYGMLPPITNDKESTSAWDYTFDETIVIGHTLLLAPVMQHYGPLMPKLDLKSIKKFEQACPLLVVGMIGDCVRGSLFEEIQRGAERGDEVAQRRLATLRSPLRLQRKMHGLLSVLLRARERCGMPGLLVDATLVGAGAFGGTVRALAQPFADCLNGGDLPFDNSIDEVNFFVFPPPKQPEELDLGPMRYRAGLNPQRGLAGIQGLTAGHLVRAVVAGFDPVSLAPHGLRNRALSAEGQVCHATDLLHRWTGVRGAFLPVRVPAEVAWESPAAFFARPREPRYKTDAAYETVRFVPHPVLEDLGLLEPRCWKAGYSSPSKRAVRDAGAARLTAHTLPRAWNGDCFEGWTLGLGDLRGRTWLEVLGDLLTARKGRYSPAVVRLRNAPPAVPRE